MLRIFGFKYMIIVVLIITCVSIPCFLISQDTIDILTVEKKVIDNIKKENTFDINDLNLVFSYYRKNNDQKFNDFFSILYEDNLEKIDFYDRQEIIHLSYEKYSLLSEKNKDLLDESYYVLRKQFLKIKERQQEILLEKAKIHFRKKEMKAGYVLLSEVMKIYDSNLLHKREMSARDYFANGKYLSYEYSHQAYIAFLQHLPVDDFRFKNFVKNIRYNKYLNHDNQIAYQIINKKLSKAGYEEIEPGSVYGKEELKRRREKSNQENEELRKKYDWVKKE